MAAFALALFTCLLLCTFALALFTCRLLCTFALALCTCRLLCTFAVYKLAALQCVAIATSLLKSCLYTF